MHEHVASHVAGETGCVIGLGQKKRPYQRKRDTLQAMASFTVYERVLLLREPARFEFFELLK